MPDITTYFDIIVDDVKFSDLTKSHISLLSYEESLTDTAKFEFKIVPTEFFSLSGLHLPLRGKIQLVLLGVEVFDGDIVKIEPSFNKIKNSHLTIIAYDRSYLFKRIPPPNIYKEANHKSIAEEIIKKHNLTPIIEPASNLKEFKLEDDQSIVQDDTTDWQILAAIAKAGDYNLLVHGDNVLLVDDNYLLTQEFSALMRPGGSRGTLRFIYRPDESSLRDKFTYPLSSFNPAAGVHDQRVNVEVKSWASQNESGVTFGKEKLSQVPSTGENYTEITVVTEKIETLRITGVAARNAMQAQYMAKSEIKRRADRLIDGEGVLAYGNPNVHVGQKDRIVLNDLQPMGYLFSGEYLLTGVKHEIDDKGSFRTSFDVRRDGLTAL